MAITTPLTPGPARPATGTHRPTPDAAPRPEPLRDLDIAVESALGADLRLLYGLGIPVLLVVAAMIPMFLFPSYVMIAAVLLFEICAMFFVIARILTVLDEDGDIDVGDPARSGALGHAA